MSAPSARAGDRATGYLTALRAGLRERGLTSTVITTGFRPRLRVSSPFPSLGPGASDFEDNIIAAPCCGGTWWFWFPWAERIMPADQLTDAADKITALLGQDDEGDEPGAGDHEDVTGP